MVRPLDAVIATHNEYQRDVAEIDSVATCSQYITLPSSARANLDEALREAAAAQARLPRAR
jgi:hypothetical protein